MINSDKQLKFLFMNDTQLVRNRSDDCGVLVRTSRTEWMSLERHEARALHRDLQKFINEWDMQNDTP